MPTGSRAQASTKKHPRSVMSRPPSQEWSFVVPHLIVDAATAGEVHAPRQVVGEARRGRDPLAEQPLIVEDLHAAGAEAEVQLQGLQQVLLVPRPQRGLESLALPPERREIGHLIRLDRPPLGGGERGGDLLPFYAGADARGDVIAAKS